MPDDPSKQPDPDPAAAPAGAGGQRLDEQATERADRGLSDFVRRAVSVGVGAASRSKDDIMRVAASEMRTWLDHLNLNDEIAKALANMVIEIKTEIRFRPSESGKLTPQTTSDVKLKGTE